MADSPLTVSAFVARVNELLETQVVWIEGEVSDVRVARGTFLTFDLKDANALVHCFGLLRRLRVPLEDGMTVRIWGIPKVYPKYGKFSITVDRIELSGEGALKRAFELLKTRLTDEGLFALERKRRLPRFPERIGLISSPEAAAYTDFLKVLRARRGGIEVFFLQVTVQGREAVAQITQAIEHMNEEYPTLDALVLTRGGGSLEELQAFNDERVVRALARSRIPTVVGVGHERDRSLADLVADMRASTPSNAAELLTPTRGELDTALASFVGRLHVAVTERIRTSERDTVHAVRVLREAVGDALSTMIGLGHRMHAVGRLMTVSLERSQERVTQFSTVLRGVMGRKTVDLTDSLRAIERVLESLHPARVLARGYSVTRDSGGVVLRDAAAVPSGTRIRTTLAHGTLHSTTDLASWPPKTPSPSQKRTKSSKKSSPPSRQATLM
jgi:exodeoxyribonuclease VII large subunit